MPAVMYYFSSFKSYRNPWQWLLFSYLRVEEDRDIGKFEEDRDIGKSRTHPFSAWLQILSYLLTPFTLAKSQCGIALLKCHPNPGLFSCEEKFLGILNLRPCHFVLLIPACLKHSKMSIILQLCLSTELNEIMKDKIHT